MNLYEISNQYTGTSYSRVYAWAPTREEAVAMALASFAEKGEATQEKDLSITLCFSSDAVPFCTRPDDEGWPEN